MVAAQRRAEVAADRLDCEIGVLHPDRLIEPQLMAQASSCAAVARSPSNSVATSPGSTCIVKNTTTLTPIRTSTSWPSRPIT
jgi:hypothetical protein